MTSFSAAALIWMHSYKLNTKMSRNSNVKEAVEHWLESIRRSYSNRPDEQRSVTDEKLLAYFIDEYRQTGRCNYPIAQTIAKMRQEGIDIGLISNGKNLLESIQGAYTLVDKACFGFNEQVGELEKSEALNLTPLRNSLIHLTEATVRLLLLTQKYTIHISLEGERQPHKRLDALTYTIKNQLSIIEKSLYSGLRSPHAKVYKQRKRIEKLQTDLIGLHRNCAELKEITQEEIREKLSLVFESSQ